MFYLECFSWSRPSIRNIYTHILAGIVYVGLKNIVYLQQLPCLYSHQNSYCSHKTIASKEESYTKEKLNPLVPKAQN